MWIYISTSGRTFPLLSIADDARRAQGSICKNKLDGNKVQAPPFSEEITYL
jgi:hypothetical protein